MKKGILLLLVALVTTFAKAQTTINITAGGLYTALEGQTGITQLVVNGTMDARDFKALHDNPAISPVSVNLSGVTAIVEYDDSITGDLGTYELYPAGELPKDAFYLLNQLTTVILPTNEAITAIGRQAFASCPSLTTVNIPASVSVIKEYAFFGCTAITGNLTIPNTVTTLEEGVFGFTSFSSITLPQGLTSIPDALFVGNTNLTSIAFPAGVTHIGKRAFKNCSGLTAINLPAGLLTLGGTQTFMGTSITTLQIPSATQIVNGLMDETFNQCTLLTSVNIPGNVTEIKTRAFKGTQISTINLPDGLTTLGSDALEDMVTLTSLELPATVVNIGPNAMGSLTSLQSLKVNNPIPVTLTPDLGVFGNTNQSTVTLQVPSGTLAAYDAADVWTDFINIEEFGEAATLEVSSNNITVAGEGESVTVTITSNVDWEAAANFNWLTLSAASGTGNDDLILTAAPNTTGATRTAIVEVSASGVESQIITVTQSDTMGNEDFNKLTVQFYPNPATDAVTVSGLQAEADLEIVNINGSLVAKQKINNNGTVSVASLPAGFYFARISSEGKIAIHKIVKK